MINQQLSRFATYDNSAYPGLWQGCVGAWAPCLGPSGARLHDYSRRMNWGTLTNMDLPTDWAVRSGAYSLDFDGANDVVVTTSRYAPGTGPLSVSCWVDGKDTSQFSLFTAMRPASFNFATQHCWLFGFGDLANGLSEKTISVLLYIPSNYRQVKTTAIVADKLRHVAFTSDGSTLRIYVDGAEAATTAASLGAWPNITQQHNTSLGAAQDATLPAACFLDDVRLYDRVLSRDEIRLLSRRRGIAFTPRTRARGTPEQAAGGATPWLYARRRSQVIGSGGIT